MTTNDFDHAMDREQGKGKIMKGKRSKCEGWDVDS